MIEIKSSKVEDFQIKESLRFLEGGEKGRKNTKQVYSREQQCIALKKDRKREIGGEQKTML